MSQLFNAYSLVDESCSVIHINNPATYTDKSYFIEAIDFLSQIQKEHSFATAKLYKTISESSTDRIAIREGFSEFFGTIKKFIKKIIDFIKKLLAKFWVRVNGMFLNDKYIETHKAELGKFEAKHEFDINGYEYTFTDTVPNNAQLITLDQSIADFAASASVGSNGKKTAKVLADLKAAYDAFIEKKNSNSYLDDIRKECIGASSNIDATDFKEELFKVYRNGDTKKSKITVTSAVCIEALSFFTGYEKLKKSTQRYSDNMERAYKEIQRKLEKVETSTVNGTNDVTIEDILDNDAGADKVALYDIFMKAKSAEIQEISNIHVMAFSAKLDAIQECYIQDKSILYGAFKKILAKSEAVDIDAIPDYVSFEEGTGLTSDERKKLPDSAFGIKSERKFPLYTSLGAKSVESAIHLFGHCAEDKKKALAKEIMKAAKKYGVTVSKDSEVYKCAKGGEE